jgi:hypothetical protein
MLEPTCTTPVWQPDAAQVCSPGAPLKPALGKAELLKAFFTTNKLLNTIATTVIFFNIIIN